MSSEEVRSILVRLSALESKVLGMESNLLKREDVRTEVDDALDQKLGRAVWKIAGVVVGGVLVAAAKGYLGL